MSIFLVDAFTDRQFTGNTAGVVLDAERFSRQMKQQIAAELKASETVFASQIESNVFQAEFFTPVTEVDFCGHATVALFHTLAAQRKIDLSSGTIELFEQTKAGTFLITVKASGNEIVVSMKQTKSQFAPALCSISEIAAALCLPVEGLAPDYPIGLAKTGNWHLIVAVKSRDYLNQINYDTVALSKILNRAQAVTAHVFYDAGGNVFHARNFGPTVGIIEDPATGSAAGAFGAYLAHEGLIADGDHAFHIVQGEQMGRISHINLNVSCQDRQMQQAEISGTAIATFQLVSAL